MQKSNLIQLSWLIGWVTEKAAPKRSSCHTGPWKVGTVERALTETQRAMEKNQHKVSEKAEGQSDVEWVKGSGRVRNLQSNKRRISLRAES